MSETDLVVAILEALALEPGVIAWRNAQITARRSGRAVRGGLGTGSPDIVACVAPFGRLLALEAKAPKGKQSDAQRVWALALVDHGGFYVVVRSVEDARAAVKQARWQAPHGAVTAHVTPCPMCEAFLAKAARRQAVPGWGGIP